MFDLIVYKNTRPLAPVYLYNIWRAMQVYLIIMIYWPFYIPIQ